jgi:hypothetical protein
MVAANLITGKLDVSHLQQKYDKKYFHDHVTHMLRYKPGYFADRSV